MTTAEVYENRYANAITYAAKPAGPSPETHAGASRIDAGRIMPIGFENCALPAGARTLLGMAHGAARRGEFNPRVAFAGFFLMKAPAFQFYADDFIGGTSAMTPAEVGIYILLLCHQWNSGSLPTDERRLFALARTNNEPINEAAVRYVVSEKFKLGEDGRLRNTRMENVRAVSDEWREKSAKGGKASAARRAGNSEWGKTMASKRTNNEPLSEPLSEPTTNSPSPSPVSSTKGDSPPLPPTVLKKKNPAIDNLPTSPEALAIADLFSRRHTTPWGPREVSAFKEAANRGVVTLEAVAIVAKYYAQERAKGQDGRHRRDLGTFLNNFDSELDRAKANTINNAKRKPDPYIAPNNRNCNAGAVAGYRAYSDKMALGLPNGGGSGA